MVHVYLVDRRLGGPELILAMPTPTSLAPCSSAWSPATVHSL
jgi:hypothetical protein